MEKVILVVGGVNDSIWGSQFKQQDRVIDKKKCSYAINTINYNGLVIRKWKRK